MTISSYIPVRLMNTQLGHAEACVEELRGSEVFSEAVSAVDIIHETSSALLQALETAGLGAINGDGLREIEAAIYGYIKESNPGRTIFATAEKVGYALEGPDKQKVLSRIAQAESLMDACKVAEAAILLDNA